MHVINIVDLDIKTVCAFLFMTLENIISKPTIYTANLEI